MTREEAIKKVEEVVPSWSEGVAELEVNALVALGLLKLDEPKSKRERFVEELERRGWSWRATKGALAAFDAVEGE